MRYLKYLLNKLVIYFGFYNINLLLKAENPGAFIAENAQEFLQNLTNIGPRIVGSYENEVLAPALIKNQIDIIKRDANASQNIEMDVQLASGSFEMNYYQNLQNIVVRLAGKSISYPILVNAHFDTVPGSSGNLRLIILNFLLL